MFDCITYAIINLLWCACYLMLEWERDSKEKKRKEKQLIKRIKSQNWLSISLRYFQSQFFLKMNSPYSSRKKNEKKKRDRKEKKIKVKLRKRRKREAFICVP